MTTAASATKDGVSPMRRRGGPKPEKEEVEEEQIPRTPAQMLVDDYRERVERKLEKEFGCAVTAVDNANGGEQVTTIVPIKSSDRKPLFIEDDVRNSLTYKFHESALDYPVFKDNVMYQKLRNRLLDFFIQQEKVKTLGKTEAIRKEEDKSGYSWEYRVELHLCLKRLLVRVIDTREPGLQDDYLKETYFWFFKKLMAMGVLTYKEQQEEKKMMNPSIDKMSNALREIISQKVTSALTDDEQYQGLSKQMFENGERTEHNETDPASVRLRTYQRRNLNMVALGDRIGEVQEKDTRLLKAKRDLEMQMAEEDKKKGLASAVLGQLYDVPEEEKSGIGGQSETTKATSNSGCRNFSHTEGAVKKHPFQTFFTTGEPVNFETVNKFEGRSNYQHYYPTGETTEQKLEQMWWYAKNKELADKRRDEETKQFLKQWSQARGRFEAEVQRRKEHINFATNFAEARGFVRTNWKSKNFDPKDDPTQYSSSTDESEYGDENRDKVASPADDVSERSGEELDDMDGEGRAHTSPSKLSRRDSISKLRKALTHRGVEPTQVMDITKGGDGNSYFMPHLPSVEQEIATLKAIQDYNAALPKAKRKKESLPEIRTHSVTSKHILRREPKKKELQRVATYHPMGIVEGYVDSMAANQDPFSLSAKKHALQRASSQQRIDNIRQHYGRFIDATPKKASEQAENVENPFRPNSYHKHMSLSVYNKPKDLAFRRPHTAATQHDLLKNIPGYKPPTTAVTIGADGNVETVPEEGGIKDSVLPQFEGTEKFELITKDATDAQRQRDMLEVLSINEELVQNNITFPLHAIKKAILMPSETQGMPLGADKYPKPGFGLVPNPFPSKKKKKKGKGKKKKR